MQDDPTISKSDRSIVAYAFAIKRWSSVINIPTAHFGSIVFSQSVGPKPPIQLAGYSSQSLHNSLPAFVGIEFRHFGSKFVGILSQILLEDHTVLIDHESHDTGVAILGRIG